MDICNSISELAYLSGIELTATLDTKVGLLKAMDILDENFDCHTADAGQQEKNFRLVEKIIEEKKNANFINIVHHVPILLQNVLLSFPAACASAWALPGPIATSRRYCSWTSPSATWTPRPAI